MIISVQSMRSVEAPTMDLKPTAQHLAEDPAPETGPSVRNEPKEVRFGQVRVHTHDITLGDNPAVSSGLPVQLQWDPRDSDRYSLEEYERLFGGGSLNRVSEEDRQKWLTRNGHTQQSFDQVHEEIKKIKGTRNLIKRQDAMRNLTPMEEYHMIMNASIKRRPRRSSPAPKEKGRKSPTMNMFRGMLRSRSKSPGSSTKEPKH